MMGAPPPPLLRPSRARGARQRVVSALGGATSPRRRAAAPVVDVAPALVGPERGGERHPGPVMCGCCGDSCGGGEDESPGRRGPVGLRARVPAVPQGCCPAGVTPHAETAARGGAVPAAFGFALHRDAVNALDICVRLPSAAGARLRPWRGAFFHAPAASPPRCVCRGLLPRRPRARGEDRRAPGLGGYAAPPPAIVQPPAVRLRPSRGWQGGTATSRRRRPTMGDRRV